MDVRFSCGLLLAFAVVSCGPPPAETTTPRTAAPSAPPPAEPIDKLPDGSFDRGSAARVIGSVDLTPCRSAGTFGHGHATLTFQPDGNVASVVVDEGPFMGTSTGACIEQTYRNIRVRPYDGGPIRVGKSFRLQ